MYFRIFKNCTYDLVNFNLYFLERTFKRCNIIDDHIYFTHC